MLPSTVFPFLLLHVLRYLLPLYTLPHTYSLHSSLFSSYMFSLPFSIFSPSQNLEERVEKEKDEEAQKGDESYEGIERLRLQTFRERLQRKALISGLQRASHTDQTSWSVWIARSSTIRRSSFASLQTETQKLQKLLVQCLRFHRGADDLDDTIYRD